MKNLYYNIFYLFLKGHAQFFFYKKTAFQRKKNVKEKKNPGMSTVTSGKIGQTGIFRLPYIEKWLCFVDLDITYWTVLAGFHIADNAHFTN